MQLTCEVSNEHEDELLYGCDSLLSVILNDEMPHSSSFLTQKVFMKRRCT